MPAPPAAHRPRVDRLAAVDLVHVPDLTGRQAAVLFADPGAAILTLTREFLLVWDRYRSDDWEERRGGSLELASGAYVQWIGYRDVLVAEVSSNAFLPDAAQLGPDEERRLQGSGFEAPGDQGPNFAATAESREECPRLALRVVAALTTVFGVYVG